jgi:hypothetical protein
VSGRPLNKFEVITPEQSQEIFGDIQSLHRANLKLMGMYGCAFVHRADYWVKP